MRLRWNPDEGAGAHSTGSTSRIALIEQTRIEAGTYAAITAFNRNDPICDARTTGDSEIVVDEGLAAVHNWAVWSDVVGVWKGLARGEFARTDYAGLAASAYIG